MELLKGVISCIFMFLEYAVTELFSAVLIFYLVACSVLLLLKLVKGVRR